MLAMWKWSSLKFSWGCCNLSTWSGVPLRITCPACKSRWDNLCKALDVIPVHDYPFLLSPPALLDPRACSGQEKVVFSHSLHYLGGDWSVLAKQPELWGFVPSAPKLSKRTSPHPEAASRILEQQKIKDPHSSSSASKYDLKQVDLIPEAKPSQFRLFSAIIHSV